VEITSTKVVTSEAQNSYLYRKRPGSFVPKQEDNENITPKEAATRA
jgi:hypothetical protein